jgi:hypothetical protein
MSHRNTAAAVNGRPTPRNSAPPEPDVELSFDDLQPHAEPPTPPPVPAWHRWYCPLCGAGFRHPWYLAAHLQKPSKPGMPHMLDEQDAWTRAAAVLPVDTTPGLPRYPTVPVIPMVAPPSAAAR